MSDIKETNETAVDAPLFIAQDTVEILFSNPQNIADVMAYLKHSSKLLVEWKIGVRRVGRVPFLVVIITRRCHVLLHLIDDFLDQFYYVRESIKRGLDISAAIEAQKFLDKVPDEIRDFLTDPSRFDYSDYQAMTRDCFITDIAMYGMVDELVDQFWDGKDFPDVYVLDELLIHGRAINEFIRTLENNLKTQLTFKIHSSGEELPSHVSKSIVDTFLDHLHIQVYIKNKEGLMLLPRYEKRLECIKPASHVEWRKDSMRFARLISVSNVNNAAFSWSFRIPAHAMQDVSNIGAVKGGFHHVVTGLQNLRMDTFLRLFPGMHDLRAAATIRFKESLTLSRHPITAGAPASEPNYLCVPFIIFNPVAPADAYKLHQQLLEDLKGYPVLCEFLSRHDDLYLKDFDTGIQLYYHWLCETNDLILSALLMSCFMEDVLHLSPRERSLYCRYIDYDPLCRNFHSIQYSYQATKSVLQEIWQTEIFTQPGLNLERYLHILTASSGPYESEEHLTADSAAAAPFLADDDPVVQSVANVVSILGLEAERNAYVRYSSAVGFSEQTLATWGKKEALRDLMLRCKDSLARLANGRSESEMLYDMLAVIVQEMDLGALGMSPAITASSDGIPSKIFTLQRAGEQSLFIWPIRYRNYLHALQRIAETTDFGSAEAEISICRFVRALPPAVQKYELEDRLIEFTQRLQWSGQTLDEWDFRMSESFDKPDPRETGPNQKKHLLSREDALTQDLLDLFTIRTTADRIV